MALHARPERKASGLNEQALMEDLALARAKSRPNVNGFGAGGGGRFSDTTVKPDQQHGVGAVGIDWPLFTGGRLKAERKEAEAELKAARASDEILRQQIELEVSRSYYRLTAIEAQRSAVAEVQATANRAVRLAHARYIAHLNSQLDVIEAQSRKANADARARQADDDYHVAEAELDFAIGVQIATQ